MSTSVRINVTLPKEVADTLKEMAGPREQSSFIAQSVHYYAQRLKRQRLLEELKEGYQATAQESVELSSEFDSTLMDGLDDENF